MWAWPTPKATGLWCPVFGLGCQSGFRSSVLVFGRASWSSVRRRWCPGVRCPVSGVQSRLTLGLWFRSLVSGVRCLVSSRMAKHRGCLVFGLWSFVDRWPFTAVSGVRCPVFGVWCPVPADRQLPRRPVLWPLVFGGQCWRPVFGFGRRWGVSGVWCPVLVFGLRFLVFGVWFYKFPQVPRRLFWDHPEVLGVRCQPPAPPYPVWD